MKDRIIFNVAYSLVLLCFAETATYSKYLADLKVDFSTSMHNIAADTAKFAPTQFKWDIAQSLYENYVMKDLTYAQSPRIPLIVHHIWVGSPLPGYAKKFRESWIQLCKGWTFILWTDHPSLEHGDVVLGSFQELRDYLQKPNHSSFIVMDMNRVVLHNQIAYKKRTRNHGERSDLIRYEVLYQVGGLYVDTDFECLRSFDDVHYALDFYIGIAYDHNFSLLNGLVGARSGDPLMLEVIKRLHNKRALGHSLTYTGPHFLTDVFFDLMSILKNRRTVAFPLTYFYPMPAVAKGSVESWLKPESYAIHHWKMSWM